MQQHCRDEHQWVNAQTRGGNKKAQKIHTDNKLWEAGVCIQTFFKEKHWFRYFIVTAADHPIDPPSNTDIGRFLEEQGNDIAQSRQDAATHANIVAGFDAHRSTAVPWLCTTGIEAYVAGRKKTEIQAAIAAASTQEPIALQLAVEFERMLRAIYAECSDSPNCIAPYPRRKAVNRLEPPGTIYNGHRRAFEIRKEAPTLRKYFLLGARFLAYFSRLASLDQPLFSPETPDCPLDEPVTLTVQQRDRWAQLVQLIVARPASPTEADDRTALHRALLSWFMSLLQVDSGASRYTSPVVSFCAFLSIQPASGAWMEARDFNSHLSAIVWLAQLLILKSAAQAEQLGAQKAGEYIQQCCQSYMQQETETPFGEIVAWRSLLFHVSRNTVSDRQVFWDVAQEVVRYNDTTLPLIDVHHLLHSEYLACHRALYENLMLGMSHVPLMRPSRLQESLGNTRVDWSFLSHVDNQGLVEPAERALLRHIHRNPRLVSLYVDTAADLPGGCQWRANAIASYEGMAQGFLQHLCVLIHLSSGQPLRESEFSSMTWRNTQRKRTILLCHGRVMIHTTYHKNQQQVGWYKDNIRFLPAAVGHLLLDFLVYVNPLRLSFLRHAEPTAVLAPFLWAERGRVWSAGYLSRCLSSACARAGVVRLQVSTWRHFTVAITKAKFADDAAFADSDGSDSDAEEVDDDLRAMHRQRNHSTRTANRAYANQTGTADANVWDGLVRRSLHVSTMWQTFWEVDRNMRDTKRKHRGEDSALSKRIALGVRRPPKLWSIAELLHHLRARWQDPAMAWRSADQATALLHVMNGHRQVVAILPTGGGKSLLFMLPPTVPDAGVTIVIVPLVALRTDLTRRLARLGIAHAIWSPTAPPAAKLVLVSVEAAASPRFRMFAMGLDEQGDLDRIVVDECHLTVTAAEYRPAFAALAELRAIRTQFVYLTATLPPLLYADFVDVNLLHQPTVVRASSHRANLYYAVPPPPPPTTPFLDHCARVIGERTAEVSGSPGGKGIVYVRSRDDAARLAALLTCEAYSAGLETVEAKAAMLARWIDGPAPWLVATTALAEGFDYAHIRTVIHVDVPASLTTFAQQAGRAGRDGQRAACLVLLPSSWRAPDPASEAPSEAPSEPGLYSRDPDLRDQHEQAALHRFLRSARCHRTSLSEFLDEPRHRRRCTAADALCHACEQGAVEPASPAGPAVAPVRMDPVKQRRVRAQGELDAYIENLRAVHGTCLYCHRRRLPWEHPFHRCPYQGKIIDERKMTIKRHQNRWLKNYSACFKCLQPQTVCPQPRRQPCEHADIVLPLCLGVYDSATGAAWLRDHFQRDFADIHAFMDWIGTETTFGGDVAIQANRVVAQALADRRGATSPERGGELGGAGGAA